MAGKTLYVSDLDGTLMRNNEQLSEYTVRTINELVEQGLSFTYATARSIESARPIAGGLKLKLPVITRNGAVLADNKCRNSGNPCQFRRILCTARILVKQRQKHKRN